MGKHDDKQRDEDEEKQQRNGRVSPDVVISPKEPEGKHSAPEDDDKDDER